MSSLNPHSGKKETSFEEAIAVVPVDGKTNLFTANIPWDWSGQYAAWGGYVAALIGQTARAYLVITQAPSKPPQPDPLNSHFQLFSPSPPGPVRLKVTLLKSGTRVTIVQVELQKPVRSIESPEDEDYKSCVLGIMTMGNLSLERGLSLPTSPTLEKGEFPDREKDFIPWSLELDPHIGELYRRTPVMNKIESWVMKGHKDGMMNDRLGKSVREFWCARADGNGFDVMSLIALVDFFGGAPGNFSPNHRDLKSGLLYPTLSMTTEIKRDPKEAMWLFLRAKAHVIRNGRCDCDVWIFDESGDLVAMSKHVSIVAEGRLAGKDEEIRRLFVGSKI